MLVQPPRELLTSQDDAAGFYTADRLRELLSSLAERLAATISPSRPLPEAVPTPASIPEVGLGITALNDLWSEIVSGSAMLGCPGMIGHMNTAPDPIASLTDALVSQLNNNLIFEELSPVASQIEELLIKEFATRLNLPAETTGTFCSGGSLANLTALFAAVGGSPMYPAARTPCWCWASQHTRLFPKLHRSSESRFPMSCICRPTTVGT